MRSIKTLTNEGQMMTAAGFGWTRRVLVAAAVALALAMGTRAHASKIMINELWRGNSMSGGTNDEWIELVLLENMTAAQLEAFYVGDSTAMGNLKAAAFKLTAMSGISSTFSAGTIIVCGGDGVVTTEDTSYNGSSDKVIQLQFAGTHLVKQNANSGDFGSSDVAWVDTVYGDATISADGFAVGWPTSASGPLFVAANLRLASAPANGGAAILGADPTSPTDTSNPSNWTTSTSSTRGAPNGGANSTAIAGLPVVVSSLQVE